MLAREELLSANVNPETGLATDYLNRFNEAIMLFEMAVDMPEMSAELTGWGPVSYVEHFEQSGFQKRATVIAAYQEACTKVRAQFDRACEETGARFCEAISALTETDPQDPARTYALSAHLEKLKGEIARLDALIHGRMVPA